jgi:hypothetical protein
VTATSTQPDAPASLSRGSRRIWRQLTALHQFEAHELIAFERALSWWERSDEWLEASKKAEGREQAQLVKQAMDAANAALRHWRTLKFSDPDAGVRRPGRPSGDQWSAKRKAQLREAI